MLLPVEQSPLRPYRAYRAETPHHVLEAPGVLAFWHLASLDAPTVAVVWALAFAWAGGIHLPLWVPILLALVTWLVYTGDRLLDARAHLHGPMGHALRERHFFHWRHRRIFIPLAAAASCMSAAVVLAFMPLMARERDSVLGAAALAYFSGVHFRRDEQGATLRVARRLFTKEFLVGSLFTTGCLLPAWPQIHTSGLAHAWLWQFWIPGVYFAALAWLNCSSIARWENEDTDRSSPSPRSPSASFRTASFLAFAGVLLAILAGLSNPRAAALLAMGALSALLLALLDLERPHFSALALRAKADLVLLTPLFLLLR